MATGFHSPGRDLEWTHGHAQPCPGLVAAACDSAVDYELAVDHELAVEDALAVGDSLLPPSWFDPGWSCLWLPRKGQL